MKRERVCSLQLQSIIMTYLLSINWFPPRSASYFDLVEFRVKMTAVAVLSN